MFLAGFQMVFDKMVANYLYFKWSGFPISDLIQNSDVGKPTFFDHSKSGRVRILDPALGEERTFVVKLSIIFM